MEGGGDFSAIVTVCTDLTFYVKLTKQHLIGLFLDSSINRLIIYVAICAESDWKKLSIQISRVVICFMPILLRQ